MSQFDNTEKMLYKRDVGISQQRESDNMTEEEYNKIFNKLVRSISELLEVSGNSDLVRIVKKKLFDFSDKIKGERENGLDKNTNGFTSK